MLQPLPSFSVASFTLPLVPRNGALGRPWRPLVQSRVLSLRLDEDGVSLTQRWAFPDSLFRVVISPCCVKVMDVCLAPLSLTSLLWILRQLDPLPKGHK